MTSNGVGWRNGDVTKIFAPMGGRRPPGGAAICSAGAGRRAGDAICSAGAGTGAGADAGAVGSSLRLFFGPTYWSNFAAARTRQLESLLKRTVAKPSWNEAEGADGLADGGDENEIVSPKVFEMRLIERIMRECYVEDPPFRARLT